MTIVPLKQHSGRLERIACQNWCVYTIGTESPYTWFAVDATNDGQDNVILSRALKVEGCVYSLVFYKAEDEVAFKLRFGL